MYTYIYIYTHIYIYICIHTYIHMYDVSFFWTVNWGRWSMAGTCWNQGWAFPLEGPLKNDIWWPRFLRKWQHFCENHWKSYSMLQKKKRYYAHLVLSDHLIHWQSWLQETHSYRSTARSFSNRWGQWDSEIGKALASRLSCAMLASWWLLPANPPFTSLRSSILLVKILRLEVKCTCLLLKISL